MVRARLEVLLVGLGVSILTAWLMLVTEPRMAIHWDEGYTLGREEALRDWFGRCAIPLDSPPRGSPGRWRTSWFSDRRAGYRPAQISSIRAEAPVRSRRSRLVLALRARGAAWPSAVLCPDWPGRRSSGAFVERAGRVPRLGPILLFSLTAGAIFSFLAIKWGKWAAALAAGSWVFQPNLFAHGHYAAYDGVLTSLWVLAVIAFISAVEQQGGVVAPSPPGVHRGFWRHSGCAAATKFTGWFLPLPFLAWAVLYRSRAGFITVAVGAVIAAIVLFALQPAWWSEPVMGVLRFLESNLSRGTTIRIKIQFLGTTYDTPRQSLPWYNTLVWTLFVTPVGFLVLGAAGIWTATRNWRQERIGILLTGHWTFLMMLRALPHTPGTRRCQAFSACIRVAGAPGRSGCALASRTLRRLGQGGDRGCSGRRGHQRRGHDARAAFVLQPCCGRASRGDKAGYGADVLLGRIWTGSPALPGSEHPAWKDLRVSGRDHILALSSANGRASAATDSLRCRPAGMGGASEPAGAVFGRRPGFGFRGPPGLHPQEARRRSGLDLSFQ